MGLSVERTGDEVVGGGGDERGMEEGNKVEREGAELGEELVEREEEIEVKEEVVEDEGEEVGGIEGEEEGGREDVLETELPPEEDIGTASVEDTDWTMVVEDSISIEVAGVVTTVDIPILSLAEEITPGKLVAGVEGTVLEAELDDLEGSVESSLVIEGIGIVLKYKTAKMTV